MQPTSSDDLNYAAIAKYARDNFKKPSSSLPGIPYLDFSTINPGKSWDCTNFVSHALVAGGAIIDDKGITHTMPNSASNWYYRSEGNRSSSWAGVIALHSYLTGNASLGSIRTRANSMSYIEFRSPNIYHPYPYLLGNVMQFYDPDPEVDTWRHSTIITGMKRNGLFVNATVTGRSVAGGAGNDNDPVFSIYPGGAKRVLWVYNGDGLV